MWGLFLKIPMRSLRHRIVPSKALDLILVPLTGSLFDLPQFDPSGDLRSKDSEAISSDFLGMCAC